MWWRPEPESLRRRLTVSLGGLLLAGALLMFVAAWRYGREASDRSYDRLLNASALAIAETVSIQQQRLQVDLPYPALDMLAMAPDDRVFYRVLAPDLSLVTGYADLPLPPSRDSAESPRYFDARYRGETVRFVVLGRYVADPELRGWAQVQVGQTRRARTALARELAASAVLPLLLVSALALALLGLGVRYALRQLARIERVLADREPTDLSPIALPAPQEIRTLLNALNQFMQRLAVNLRSTRGFIAEAAHQMRTPLAALRAQAQEALDEDDPQQMRRSLHTIERNAIKLSRLLNQMISDATVFHRADAFRREATDLLAVLQEAVRDALPPEHAAVVELSCEVEQAPVLGDPLMLREAVKNLLDNALRYAADSRIEVQLARQASDWRLCIADRGPGLPADELERVFERFVRRSDRAGGAGLGLAIVRRVAEVHGGSIVLQQRDGGGLCAILRIPGRA